jgi:putative IMPACT (imprinted ancient) family translation regulator
MQRLRASALHRFREKGSVFLTELHPAADASAREAILATLRKRDFDATHHCSAWREGIPVTAAGSDDDGEPGGTAGAPMLRVLEGAEVSDLIAVCIRWYGGTKLGTGGLVKAYTEGVQGALAVAQAEGLLETWVPLLHGSIACAPEQAHLPYQLLGAFPGARVQGQTFQAGLATLRFALPPEEGPRLETLWRERSRGGTVTWEGIFADP